MSRSLYALSVLALSIASPHATKAADPQKQLVLISFDGAGDNKLWDKSLAMAKASGAHFTYFLSCTNLMTRQQGAAYKAPGMKAGRSNVGFAVSTEDVRTRLDHIWNAHLQGHEIASHGCGHFDGKDWTKADWLKEMRSFDDVVLNAWQTAGIANKEPEGWRDFATHGIKGFRAPYLSTSDSLHAAEREAGFTFDASLVTNGPQLPDTEKGLTAFGLPLILEGPKQRRIIGMDYNLFVRHSAGMDNPSRTREFEERAYQAFRAAFDEQYDGDRIPLQLGFHFVEMNAGAYWRALDRIVSEVCGIEDVACVSYSEAMQSVNAERQEPKSVSQ